MRRQRPVLVALLTVFLACVYMLTYSARIESTDTLFMFDATASLVRFGDLRLDLTAGERRYWEYEEPLPDLPLLRVDAEPLQILLAAPLYWLADHAPGIGRVHTVWLFNVGVTALAGGLFYLYALHLCRDDVTALIAALLMGLSTIVWAYSKTFFQEPLTLLLVLLAAYCVERWRSAGWRAWGWVAAAVIAFGLGLLARRAALLALPLLAIIAFPWLDVLFRPRWCRWGVLVAVLVIAPVLYAFTRGASYDELIVLFPYRADEPFNTLVHRAEFNQGVRAHLFSIGGSLWGTSPILLLAVPGMVMLGRRNQMRYVLVALTGLLLYTLVYAYASGGLWFGGLSWPPRFLVPLVPFWMLCALPMIVWLRARVRPWALVAVVVLLGYSLWVQFNALSYWWGEYTPLLPPEAQGFIEWRGGLNDPRYLRWVLLPRLWGTVPLDFAWVRTGTPAFGVMFAAGAAVMALVIAWLRRPRLLSPRLRAGLLAAPPLALVVMLSVGLWLIRVDDEYLAFSPGLHRAVDVINQEMTADDLLITSQLGYERFFLNYGAVRGTRIISLPEHPGEQPSPDQPAVVRSPHPADLLENPTAAFIHTVARDRERLWVLHHSAPYIPWSVRPLERYMAAVYFPLRTIDTSEGDGLPVRLTEYITAAQHDPYTLAGAQYPSALRYTRADDTLALAGYNLPLGSAYPPGAAVPISLYWVAEAAPTADYTVAFYAAEAGGGVIAAGQDTAPYAGFAPTSTWMAGQPVWDNRALRLPPDLPPGGYELWVAVYGFDANGEVDLMRVAGGESAEDGTIGVLPTRINVTAP